MEEKTIQGVKWIVGILDKHSIPYRIGGGFAAHLYGSNRPVNDVDISLSGIYFPTIVSEVSAYITAGPKHYSNEKWDCDTLSLNYQGQDIDMTDVDTVRMSSKDKTEWFQVKDHFRKFPAVPTEFAGSTISLMDPRDLVAYKKHLGGDHQEMDIEAVQKYIHENGL